jgi:hypothetical protein
VLGDTPEEQPARVQPAQEPIQNLMNSNRPHLVCRPRRRAAVRLLLLLVVLLLLLPLLLLLLPDEPHAHTRSLSDTNYPYSDDD